MAVCSVSSPDGVDPTRETLNNARELPAHAHSDDRYEGGPGFGVLFGCVLYVFTSNSIDHIYKDTGQYIPVETLQVKGH